jgi:hypothetical protein
MTACEFATLPVASEQAAVGGQRMSFTIPDGWARLEGTTATHYLTTGDPDVCEGVVGSCDPAT